jgi:hypothetical protein
MADGVTLSKVAFSGKGDSAKLSLVGRSLPNSHNSGLEYEIEYSLERDNFGNYKYFSLSGNTLTFTGTTEVLQSKPVWLLNIKASIILKDCSDTTLKAYATSWNEYQRVNAGFYQS